MCNITAVGDQTDEFFLTSGGATTRSDFWHTSGGFWLAVAVGVATLALLVVVVVIVL